MCQKILFFIFEKNSDICSSCSTTGFTKEVGCIYPDGDNIYLENTKKDTFEECMAHCAQIDLCKGATYFPATQNCHPQSGGWDSQCLYNDRSFGRKCDQVTECSAGKLKIH